MAFFFSISTRKSSAGMSLALKKLFRVGWDIVPDEESSVRPIWHLLHRNCPVDSCSLPACRAQSTRNNFCLSARRWAQVKPTVQPLRVVQPDAVCEVGSSTPDSFIWGPGDFPWGRPNRENCTLAKKQQTHWGCPFQSA